MRVLCADCGHREAMPRSVAKLALESRQDPKCPRCRSANLTMDAARGHMTTTASAAQRDAEKRAYDAGKSRALSLNPGSPIANSAALPTAAEREAYRAGWFAGKQEASQQRTGVRRHASDPKDPEMVYGPESGYWEAEDEHYREQWQKRMMDEVEDPDAGWDYLKQQDMMKDEEPMRDPYDEGMERGARRRWARRRLSYTYNDAGEITDWGRDDAPYDGEVDYDDRAGEWSEADAEREEEELRARFYDPFMEQIGRWLTPEWAGRKLIAPKPLWQMFDDFIATYDKGNYEWWEGDRYMFVEKWLEKNLVDGDTRTAARRRPTTRRTAMRRSAMRRVASPQVWIASLSDYNNGDMVGKWVDATSIESLEEGVEEVLAMSRQPDAEEWAIHDYDGFGDLGSMLGEYPDIEKVAAFGALLEEHGDVALAAIDTGYSDDPDDIANLIDEGYQGQFSSDEEFVMNLIDDIGFGSLSNPESYFDYERWGRDVAEEWSWSEDDDDPDPSLESLRNDYGGDYGEWAYNLIDDMGGVDAMDGDSRASYIRWDSLTYDVMMDYMESGGHYFRAL